MRTYKALQAEMERLRKQMEAANVRERDDAVVEAGRLCRDFDITATMLKGSLAIPRRGRKPGPKKVS